METETSEKTLCYCVHCIGQGIIVWPDGIHRCRACGGSGVYVGETFFNSDQSTEQEAKEPVNS